MGWPCNFEQLNQRKRSYACELYAPSYVAKLQATESADYERHLR
jgi:hypothetical protein